MDRDRLRHLVYVSIVGVDRIPYGYYRAKFAAEQVLLASGLPVTLLRVTQFHEFVDILLDTARRGPVLPVPMGWRVQPVDVGEVAEHVTEVVRRARRRAAWSSSADRRSVAAADLARAWAAARASGAHVVATPVPGKLGRGLPGRRRAADRRCARAPDLRRAPERLSATAAAPASNRCGTARPGAVSDNRRKPSDPPPRVRP